MMHTHKSEVDKGAEEVKPLAITYTPKFPYFRQSVRKSLLDWTQPALQTLVFLLAVVLCGLIFGGFTAGQLGPGESAVIGQAVQGLLTAVAHHQLATPDELLRQKVIQDGRLLALLWLFGLSILGLPFVVIALFLRAFTIGFAVGFTVIHFGWQGVLLAGLGIFAHQILSLSALLCGGVVAVRFSANVLQSAYNKRELTTKILKYSLTFAIIGGVMVLAGWLQSSIEPVLLSGTLGH
ncbi:stage II sporulation protein M [Alicyclobacillaceae bacterium I2511]|jgi:stage II sporulation protein M|nr:stage II sporulation protein M [Alicyclobacillaceae bacterium I2511]